MEIVKTYTGWAINSRSKEGHGLIGRYWFLGRRETLPVFLEGHKIALFKTRQVARDNLFYVRSAFPKARVERVTIAITR